MPKTHTITIGSETHGLAGNLVLPDQASPETPVPGAVILGGPGPVPLQRYSEQGAKEWPVLWGEALAEAGVAGLCYDQRGSGLSTGVYAEADWSALLDDARAVAEMLAVQPEVRGTAAIAWAEGCHFGLQLAAEGKVDALVLMAPAFTTEEERYSRSLRQLAARKGLSERVVELRLSQWRNELMATARRVKQGETTSTVDFGDKTVTTNLVRFLQTVTFDPAPWAARVSVPVLLLHGGEDLAFPPAESEALAAGLAGPSDRILYPGAAHFLYRHAPARSDAATWLKKRLATR